MQNLKILMIRFVADRVSRLVFNSKRRPTRYKHRPATQCIPPTWRR